MLRLLVLFAGRVSMSSYRSTRKTTRSFFVCCALINVYDRLISNGEVWGPVDAHKTDLLISVPPGAEK